MSNNAGFMTRTEDNTRARVSDYMSTGMITRTICPACRKPKKAGIPHRKCSRKLQQMYFNGEL